MADYLIALYGHDKHIERQKKIIQDLPKVYKGMHDTPQFAELKFYNVRVWDYDREYFEDYFASRKERTGTQMEKWLKTKCSKTIGAMFGLCYKHGLSKLGFKPFTPTRTTKIKHKFSLATMRMFMLGRREDDYFNLLPTVLKPKSIYKNPKNIKWNMETAKQHAKEFNLTKPVQPATAEHMKKVNTKNAKKKIGKKRTRI